MLKKSISFFVAISFLAFFTIASLAKMPVRNEKSFSLSKKINFQSGGSTQARTVKIRNEYSLEIPQHMYEGHDLNDDASLQYEDSANELYIIVIDESKADFIRDFTASKDYKTNYSPAKNYRMVQMKSMQSKMTMSGNPKIKSTNLHGLGTEIADFDATVPGIVPMITYKVAFIEGPVNMYMIMTWTTTNFKTKHSDEMNKMVQSFRVLN